MKTKQRPRRAAKTAKAKRAKAPKKEGVSTIFLLDRSGSMSMCRDETISGFNGYLDGLLKDKDSKSGMRFTLVQFDSIGIDTIHDNVPLNEVRRLSFDTYLPRASTPLYDAIGQTIKLAEKHAKKRNMLFVTLTDGQENASSKWNGDSIRSLIKEKEKENWTFAHIGVGVDGFKAVQTYSIGTMSHCNTMSSSVSDSKGRFGKLGRMSKKYMARSVAAGGQVVNCVTNVWDDEDEE